IRRHRALVKNLNANPHVIQESQKEFMQPEKKLLERHISDGRKYIEANEKVHVTGKKLKQLLEGVSHDLTITWSTQDISAFFQFVDELNVRDALPFQLLCLLLSLLAFMIPSSEKDYSCSEANNFAHWFYPMLQYINGLTPT
ncbi:PREDICTED: nesprin-2-like, partial [Gekko japonicus]|uniref:Nesprin-2-like n=1 Tax=Gekko japonicus TaxID=146911 RepID=A0ABM1L3N1_GEKJA